MAEIHNYQNEALIFGDEDYYDIDFYTGTGYESKKILGSTIKAGIIASIPAPNVKTIYSDDDNVAGNRTVKGTAGTHFFKMIDFSTFEFTAQNTESECFKINVPTGDSFTSFVIANSANNNPMFSIESGYVKINDKWRLPLNDGATGQILSTDGAGLAKWIDAPTSGVTSVQLLTGAINLIGDGIQVQGNPLLNAITLTNNEIIDSQIWNSPKISYFENDYFFFQFDSLLRSWIITLKPLPFGLVGWQWIASASIASTANFPTTFGNMNNVGLQYPIWPTGTAKNNQMRFNVSIRPIVNIGEPQPKFGFPLFQQECWESANEDGSIFQVSSLLRQIDFNNTILS